MKKTRKHSELEMLELTNGEGGTVVMLGSLLIFMRIHNLAVPQNEAEADRILAKFIQMERKITLERLQKMQNRK